ncbi:hypothetical protein FQA39_LY11754 [Lamprigera yunnana]|nr:hypothetical protein FQA39_LY11754 [Lamprigera yunnana]
MRKELRQILALEKLHKTIVYPKCTVVFDDKVNACEEKLNVLKDKISIFKCDSSRKEFLVLDSRLSHLMCRVDNIPMTNVDEKQDVLRWFRSDGSDDGEVSDEERPGVSTSTPTRVRDTDLESTNVSEKRVASGSKDQCAEGPVSLTHLPVLAVSPNKTDMVQDHDLFIPLLHNTT